MIRNKDKETEKEKVHFPELGIIIKRLKFIMENLYGRKFYI